MEDIPAVIGDWKLYRTLKAGNFDSTVLSWLNIKTHEKIVTKIWSVRNDESIEYCTGRCMIEINFYKNYENDNIISLKELPKVFEAGLAPINKRLLPVLCMEYCHTDLRQVLLDCENSCGLQESHVREILEDVNSAVYFLYDNRIPQRNLSPDNIVRQYVEPHINRFDTRSYIYKIIDVSLDGLINDKEYSAPEVFMNSEMISGAADFWSFGLVAFEIICGVKPFLPSKNITERMALARVKSHDNICAYETFHGDIEFSCEILPENHLSMHFKTLIEKWLKTALEWQPHLRGREAPIVPFDEDKFSTKNLNIFTLLEDILDTSEVKIFSVFTLEYLCFDFNDLTSIGVLKAKIKESTEIHELDQLLISTKTNMEPQNDELVSELWETNSSTSFFLFNKKMFLKDDINYIIPRSVNRAITSKALIYNFTNSYELYRCGCYFVHSQKELFNEILRAITVHAEYFHQESKDLMFHYNSLSKVIDKLEAKHEFASYLFQAGKRSLTTSYRLNRVGHSFSGVFNKFNKTFDNISYNWKKFSGAWEQLSIRLESCSKRSLEFSLQECNLLFEKYDLTDIIKDANIAYDNYLKNIEDHKVKGNVSIESIKIACQEALKIKSRFLTELRQQSFIIKMMDLSVEISKLKVILQSASNNSNKLRTELTEVTRDLTDTMWSTFRILGSSDYSEFELKTANYFKPNEDGNNCAQRFSETEGASATETESLVETSAMLRNTNSQRTAALLTNKGLAEDFSFLEDS